MKNDIEKAQNLLINGVTIKNLDEIRTPRFRLSDLKINPRNAVHWELKGAFLNKKPEGKWHILDLTEATWILIVKKLREYNFNLELIIDLKDSFLNQKTKFNDDNKLLQIKNVLRQLSTENIDHIINSNEFDSFIDKMTLSILEMIIMDILNLRNQYKILFNLEGQYVILKDGSIDNPMNDSIAEIQSQSHFSLNINEIIGEILGKMDLNTAFSSYQMISKNEMEILKLLRDDDAKSIEIKMNPQTSKPEKIEIKKIIKPGLKTRLDQIVMKNGYQEIIVKSQNGKIFHCENKIKQKLDTE
jgi:hypothetical protein